MWGWRCRKYLEASAIEVVEGAEAESAVESCYDRVSGKPRSHTQCRQQGASAVSHASKLAALPLDMVCHLEAGVIASLARRIPQWKGAVHIEHVV